MSASSAVRPPEERYVIATAVFLRLVGLCFVFAFTSLGVQVRGLIGAHGILPAREVLGALARMGGARAFFVAPTIFPAGVSDGVLVAACVAGVLASALVVAGVFQAPMLALSWLFYLSLCSVGRDFLSFQWDALLLETGFLAVFLAPWTWRPTAWRTRATPALPLWLLRLLLLRLMVASGAVKLASGDPMWRSLRALQLHYETQPLPTWVGYFAHQLPAGFQRLSCGMVFALELVVPVLLFLPRPFRRFAAFSLIGFMLLIDATGNYAFFGLLTIALCVLFLDDGLFPRRVRERVGELQRRPRWLLYVALPFAAAWLLLSAIAFTRSVTGHVELPPPLAQAVRWTKGFRTVNRYGLFAVMTTERREIVIEGSDDRVSWKPYEFKWKPQALDRRPAFVEPHQPRLDWQMWFAALGTCESTDWFLPFLTRLVENEPEVTALLADNPFPQHGPKFLRTTLYDYRFTDLATWWRTGRWWRREEIAPFCPVLSAKAVRMGRR